MLIAFLFLCYPHLLPYGAFPLLRQKDIILSSFPVNFRIPYQSHIFQKHNISMMVNVLQIEFLASTKLINTVYIAYTKPKFTPAKDKYISIRILAGATAIQVGNQIGEHRLSNMYLCLRNTYICMKANKSQASKNFLPSAGPGKIGLHCFEFGTVRPVFGTQIMAK